MKTIAGLLFCLILFLLAVLGVYVTLPEFLPENVVILLDDLSVKALEVTEKTIVEAQSPESEPAEVLTPEADGELVSEESTQGLEDSGISGAEYSFDSTFYPYYGFLTAAEQQIYKQIYANVSQLCDTFVPVTSITVDEAANAIEAIFNDHPELFWLDTSYAYRYTSGGDCVQIILFFNETYDYINSAKAAFDSSAEAILSVAAGLASDYEKEKYVHDALLEKMDYTSEATMHQSAYSALVGGETVCAGYARAFQYLMTELGIPTYYCSGYSEGNHAWNIVKLGDGYYNVDLTWDDASTSQYDFFNRTDKDLSATHQRVKNSVYLPACTATAYRGLENNTAVPTEVPDPVRNQKTHETQPESESVQPTMPENTPTAPTIPETDPQENRNNSHGKMGRQ